jgi:hypothetical protein
MTVEAAHAFRRQLMDVDFTFAETLAALVAPLRERRNRHPTPRPDLLRAARRSWINDIPSFGCLSGPHPELGRNRLTIAETRVMAARFDCDKWSIPPQSGLGAERQEDGPGFALVANRLTVAPGVLRFEIALLALVRLDAVTEWFAGRPDASAARLIADFVELANFAAAASELGPVICPGDGGTWVGEVTAGPRVTGGARVGTVVMVSQFVRETAAV